MINTREIAEEYRLTYWAQVMQERVESGLTKKAFCKQIGICGNTYFYWQRKLREAAVNENSEKTTESTQALVPKGWMQMSKSEGMKDSSLRIEIGLCKVFVNEDTDPELLLKACRVLTTL